MSEQVDFESRYRQTLLAHLDHEDIEAPLAEAMDLGKSALARGHSLLDLVSMHLRAISSLAGTMRYAVDDFGKAEEVLAEVLAPFEMVNRSWQDVVTRLNRMNQSLEREITERTAALRQSEQRFRDITEIGGDWIWECDAGHRFTFFAGQSLDTAAIPSESALGRTWWELAGADPERDDGWRRYKAIIDGRHPFRRFHHVMVAPGGARLYVAASGKPIFDEWGEFLGYRGTASDETVVINAHHRTEQAETLLRDALESIYEGFAIFDKDDRLVTCNRAYREMHALCAGLLEPGASLQQLLRCFAAHGLYPDAIGREEEWVAAWLRQHRDPKGAMEYRFAGRRWLLATERTMTNGGTAGLSIDITALKSAQAALRESERHLDRAQRMAGTGSWELDVASGRFVWSKELYRLTSLTPETFEPTLVSLSSHIHEEDRPRLREWLDSLGAGIVQPALEIRIRRANGDLRTANIEGQAIADGAGKIVKIAGTLQDVTERRSLERQLAHAQKMEAIGNLTGGMAHDFNNLLGVIIGNLDMLRDRHGAEPEIDELSRDALDAATRGADLTRGLLAFARQQPLRPQVIEINAVIANITKLLRRTLGERIEISLSLAADVWPVMADAVQLEAAITNLATNARDAMPKGGTLSIATLNRQLDEDYAGEHPEVLPGDYATIEVCDTGTGIPQESLSRIFEPFFTTKERGQGTGLGLAMVFGYVKQSGGHIYVYSEVGTGTTFRLYLPRAQHAVARAEAPPSERAPRGQGETVLVVEDNASLRRVAVRQLVELGYTVKDVENARAALDLLEAGVAVDALFSDVVMPGEIDGLELAEMVKQRWSRIAVVLTSGFAGAQIANGTATLLSKPYRKDELAQTLRRVLDASKEAAGGARAN